MKTLHGKLSAVLFGLLCLIGALYLALTIFTTRMYLREVNQKVNARLASDLATHLAARGLLLPTPEARAGARAEIKELMAINPSVEVYLLDAQGKILTYSADPGQVKRQRVSLGPLRRFLNGSAALPILGDDPRDPAGQKIFSATSYSSGGQPGYVYVILGGEDYDSVSRMFAGSAILRSSLAMAAIIAAFVLVTGWLLFHWLTRRLRRLTGVLEAFGAEAGVGSVSGELDRPRDEIDRLDLVYRRMADRIQAQIGELARADSLRRELVGNVSHDLRTPLTALQGYLETLLMKEGALTSEEQREYLLTAARHADRLSALVAELFELARLDSRDTQARPEPFALGELVQDIAQQFRLTAEQKGVRLQPQIPEDLPFAFADIGLIERVLENLLENALRYTPKDGLVTVHLQPEGEKIAVRVRDTGYGISPEHLPHIFERFYRVQTQPDRPGCAGLGLAIATRILELHGSLLEVESVPDQGTTFTFFLPVARFLTDP